MAPVGRQEAEPAPRTPGAGRRPWREAEGGGAAAVAAALAAAGVDAILCRPDGRILQLTGEAERLFAGDGVRLVGNRLEPRQAARQVRAALAAAAEGKAACVVVPSGPQSPRPLVLRLHGLSMGAGRPNLVLILVGRDRSPDPAAWRAAFDLTPAEAEVAAGLLAGRSAREIAADRGVSPETVRSHLKTIYHKAGVNRAGQLLAVLRQHG